MATLSSTGIGSGLDVSTLISGLMAVEQRPLTLLQTTQTTLNTKLSKIGTLQSYVSSMRDAAQKLASVSLWKQTSATSSNSAVGVATDGSAAAGSYAVSVQQLAGPQTVSSGVFSGSDAVPGAGTLTIELGSWDGEPSPTGFTPKSGSSAVVVMIDADDTLAEVRDKINAAAGGIAASLVTDASGTRLALRSSATGAENAFRIGADGALSGLAYDATASSPMTRSQTAANAQATVNGIAVSSASNTLDGVVEGLTLTLRAVTTGDAQIDVSADTAAQKDAITSFVSAFNTMASYIRTQTKYDADSKTAGDLQGDSTVLGLQSQLRAVLNQQSSAADSWSTLSDIGISMNSTGQLTVNDSKLGAALADPTQLRQLLATDGDDNASSGFMDRFRDLGNAVLGTDGSLTSRTASLQALIDRNQDSQDAMQRRLDATQARLEAQYQSLDTLMASLSSTSTYLTQQLAAMTKSSS